MTSTWLTWPLIKYLTFTWLIWLTWPADTLISHKVNSFKCKKGNRIQKWKSWSGERGIEYFIFTYFACDKLLTQIFGFSSAKTHVSQYSTDFNTKVLGFILVSSLYFQVNPSSTFIIPFYTFGLCGGLSFVFLTIEVYSQDHQPRKSVANVQSVYYIFVPSLIVDLAYKTRLRSVMFRPQFL